jgi:hypothetical protein
VVSADVSGLDAGYGATLDIEIDGTLFFAGDLGEHCTRITAQHARCTMTHDFAGVEFTSAVPSRDTTLTFVITPAEGTPNDVTTDDSASVTLPRREREQPDRTRDAR